MRLPSSILSIARIDIRPMARRSFIAPCSFVISGSAIHNCVESGKIYGGYFARLCVPLRLDARRALQSVLKLSCDCCGVIEHNVESAAQYSHGIGAGTRSHTGRAVSAGSQPT